MKKVTLPLKTLLHLFTAFQMIPPQANVQSELLTLKVRVFVSSYISWCAQECGSIILLSGLKLLLGHRLAFFSLD